MRYAGEVIELQDFCQFRTEVDVYPTRFSDNCYLSVELHFADLSSFNITDLLHDNVTLFTKSRTSILLFSRWPTSR